MLLATLLWLSLPGGQDGRQRASRARPGKARGLLQQPPTLALPLTSILHQDPAPHPDPGPSQAFYSGLSREGREGYAAILSTSISKVLSSVNFIAEAQLDSNALRNCGELCTYLPLRSGAMVFEQVHPYYRMCGFALPACYVFYEPVSARLVLSHLLTASRAIPPTLSSS